MEQAKDQESPATQPASLSDLEKEDVKDAADMEAKIDRCFQMIKEMDTDIASLMRSQDYYRKRMRRLAKSRDVKLNLRLL